MFPNLKKSFLLTPVLLEALRYLDVHMELPEETEESVVKDYKTILTSLLLNSSLSSLKETTPNYSYVESKTTRAIDRLQLSDTDKGAVISKKKEDNSRAKSSFFPAKALYRRALARSGLKSEDEAEADLIQANQLVPSDQAILAELAKVREHKKQRREKEKKAFKKLFD